MEPAKLLVTHIPCPLHEDVIRRVGIINKTDLSLYCSECMESMGVNQKQERYLLENFLRQFAQSYAQVPKLTQLPDSTNQILNTQNEMIANFTHHIEQQKEQINTVFDKLRQSVYQKLENKKRQLIATLEAQVKAFEEVLNFHKQKVSRYKKGHQDEDAKDQAKAITFESLFQEVSKLTNATELKKLLLIHYDKMKKIEIFSRMKGDEAKKLVITAIEAMDIEIMKIETVKPSISFGAANESLEELVKKWSERVEDIINELKFELKGSVKPIKFQIPNFKDFDSLILKDELESKTMIAEWVFETMKLNGGSFNLLYRGSKNGFGANDFHNKCDNKGPTVVIIESTVGKKFGGYASVSWTSSWITKTKMMSIQTEENFSFLFSVDKKQKLPYRPKSGKTVLYHDKEFGPVFGSSALSIRDDCNTTNNNSSDNCDAFEALEGGEYISGSDKFTVKEIEVYSIVPFSI